MDLLPLCCSSSRPPYSSLLTTLTYGRSAILVELFSSSTFLATPIFGEFGTSMAVKVECSIVGMIVVRNFSPLIGSLSARL